MRHYEAEFDAYCKKELRGDIGVDTSKKGEEDWGCGISWSHTPTKPEQNSSVSSPNHYCKLGYECIEIIASSLSKEAFKGYCIGNFLKYRFRMGDKDDMKQDFDKSKEYLDIYERWNHLCKDNTGLKTISPN
jgi:hypothetical protein